MQHFSKRFHEKANKQLLHFHSSINFDKRLAKEDIEGSIAHTKGLVKQGIINEEEGIKIIEGLKILFYKIEEGEFLYSEEFEDIHMNIEHALLEEIGEVAKKLHTGRSRNDQVAVDMKLFVRKELEESLTLIKELINNLLTLAKENLLTYMPVFTHLQKAQVSTFAHYIMAYVEMFDRDYKRIKNSIDLLNFSPLGAAALTGSTHPLDRNFTSELLGFIAPTKNSLDSVSDRDYLLDAIYNYSVVMMHLSRFCEELIIFSSQDCNYIEFSDDFSTGSSIMPQKKNPDAAELIRGKSGRVFGDLFAMLTVMKGLPLAYNKDLQEDKESFFDALDTTKACLSIFKNMIMKITINKERMCKACYDGYIEATDMADYLAKKGLPFRDAYGIVGNMVKDAISEKSLFPGWTLEKFKSYSPLFENDIYKSISLEEMLNKRDTIGSPKPERVLEHIESFTKFLVK